MPTCYVVFYGKTPGIYLTWHECSKQVLGSEMLYTRSIVTMSRLLEIFQAAMRDVNPPLGAAPPLPYDPVPQDAFA